MRYQQTTQQHATQPNTIGLQVIIQQARRRAAWQGIQQDAQATIANRNYYKPFAY